MKINGEKNKFFKIINFNWIKQDVIAEEKKEEVAAAVSEAVVVAPVAVAEETTPVDEPTPELPVVQEAAPATPEVPAAPEETPEVVQVSLCSWSPSSVLKKKD